MVIVRYVIRICSLINFYKGLTELSIINGQFILQKEPKHCVVDFLKGGSFAPNEPPLRTGLPPVI